MQSLRYRSKIRLTRREPPALVIPRPRFATMTRGFFAITLRDGVVNRHCGLGRRANGATLGAPSSLLGRFTAAVAVIAYVLTGPSLLALLSVAVAANAAPFCSASVDADGNIHVRSPAGVDQRITDDGHYDAPLLAANGAIVAWRRSFNAINIEDDHGELGALYLYDGTTRVLHCEPVLRDFWFVRDGAQVGIDCGGLHFAGIERLHNAKTLVEVDRFDQSEIPFEQRPDWADGTGSSYNCGALANP
jgi:hypothetical protein